MDALAHLLSPIAPETFVRDYFDLRPLYIRGHPEKFDPLFRPEDLKVSLAGARIHANLGGARQLQHVDPRDIDCLLASGATLCAGDLERANPKLSAFAAEVGARLGFAGAIDVRAYWSPDGHGFDMHFDARVATVLQISGKKRWRYSQTPAIEHPTENVTGENGVFRYVRENPTPHPWESFAPPDRSTFDEVVLEPGDVLCLPAGTWHEARAIGHSLALNVAFTPLGFRAFLEDTVLARLLALPEWRRAPPPILAGERGVHAPPPEVTQFFADRLGELKELIAELDPAGPELAHAWRRRMYARSGDAPGSDAAPVSPRALDPMDWLERAPGPMEAGYFIDETYTKRAALYRIGHCFRLPVERFPLACWIVDRTGPFPAGQAEGLEWEHAAPLLSRLVEVGFLIRVRAP
jgi:hypothetical protein